MKKRKTNQLKLWAIGVLAILLLAAPSGWAVVVECYPEGSPHLIDADNIDCLNVWSDATVNLYTSVPNVFVAPGGILNIYSGDIGWLAINTANPDEGETDAIVTVYGIDFKADWLRDGTIVSLDGETEFTPDVDFGSALIATDENGYPINLLWCFSDTPIHLVDLKKNEETIKIDVKPGCNPNTINLMSKGVVPVALLSEGNFKAGDIDTGSVEFAGASPVRSTLCDVDGDGDMDMLFHFKTQDLDLNEESTEAELTFTTTGGEQITATDSVKIVPFSEKKKNKHLSDSKNKKKDNHVSDKKHKFAKKNTPKPKRPDPKNRKNR